jgi:hypothetical protein
MIDPHQGVARGREVGHLQVYADEVRASGTEPFLVAARDSMALPSQLVGIPLTVGRAANPADGLVFMRRRWTGRVQE